MIPMNSKSKVGDCEAIAEHVNVKISLTHNNMWLCDECIEKENKIIEREKAAKILIGKFAQNNIESVNRVQDIHNNATVPITELRAAIEHDSSIPDEQKNYVFAQKCQEHLIHYREIMFNKRKELTEAENAASAWQTNGQAAVGKLRSDLQDEFKALRIDYKPIVAKTKNIKKAASDKPVMSSKAMAIAAKEAASKYGVESFAVQMIAKQRNWTVDDAAKFLAIQMGKLKAN